MFEGLVISSIFCAIGFLGWAHAEWRIKREEFRVNADLEYRVIDLRERLATAEKQTEWYRSRQNHPAVRRVK